MDLPYISGFGLVASHRRNIRPGTEYDKYFPTNTLGTDPYLEDAPTVFGTLDHIENIVAKTLSDTKRIAPVLKGNTLLETCNNIFHFCYDHIQYKQDKERVEQLRRPARAWLDRKSGIDCDCFSILVSSILTNLGIKHALRIIELRDPDTGKPKGYYQHIYVVVPYNNDYTPGSRGGYYTIDPVLDRPNKEAPGITKISDRQMKVQYLNGLGNMDTDPEINSLAGLEGCATCNQVHDQFFGWLQNELSGILDVVKSNPHMVEPVYNAETLIGCLGFTIDNLHNEDAYPMIAGFDTIYQTGLLGEIEDELFGMDYMLGKAKNKKKPGLFTKVATAAKAVKTKAKETVKKVADTKVVKAYANVAKKAAKAVVKYNPVSTAARAGFLLAMETNMFKIADQLRWAYATDDQLRKYNVSKQDRDKAKNALAKVEKMFVGVLKGKPENLKKAILSGKQKLSGAFEGLGYMGEVYELLGLGEVVAATGGTAAAMTFILKAKEFIKGLNITGKLSKISEVVKNNPKLKELAQKAVRNIVEKNTAAKTESNIIDDGSGSEQNNEPPPQTPEPPPAAPEPEQTNYTNSQTEMLPQETPSETSETSNIEEPEDKTTPDPKPEKKSNTGLFIGLGIGALILGALAFGGSKRNRGMNGLGNVEPETVDVEVEVLSGATKTSRKKRAPAKAGRRKKAHSYTL
jgi:hypothetical protein